MPIKPDNHLTNLQKDKQSATRSAAKDPANLTEISEKLEESEARYRAIFEYTGTAMIVIDRDTTILMANHKLEEITGYAHEESLKRRKWTEVVVPEDAERMMEYHQKRRDNPDSVPNEYEFRLIDKNGNRRDLLLNAVLIPGTDQTLVSLVDITPLRSSVRALRESEKRYRNLVENATDIIYTTDLEGNFTSANASALATYGFTAEDILKTNIRALIDPAYLQLALEKMADKISSPSSTRYELLTRTGSGKPVWIEVSTRIIREADRSIGIQGIARDITERKLYEEQLRDSITRFKETADLLPGIICEIDTNLRLTYTNELGLTFFGFTHEDFERGISVLDIVPLNERPRFLQDVANISSGDFGNPKLYELVRQDGSRLQMIINSAPIQKNGITVGIRSSLVDITDRVTAELRLRESEERFRTIFSSSPIGIALFSPDGRLTDNNISFSAMAPAEINLSQQGALFSIPGMSKALREKLDEGIPVNYETSYRTEGGGSISKLSFEWNLTTICSAEKEPAMYLAQVQNITIRKQTLDAVIQKERNATARAEALVVGLQRELREKKGISNMVSRSPQMQQIFGILPEVAQASATVMVIGDSGTGKELIARSLHDLSSRKERPFVAINCSALPDNLLESELFGYCAGAFTDAKKDKPGRFALAEGGTIFLDEIGDISPAMQVKLLRVLQERIYEPLGATTPQTADVRVIAATNKDLRAMVTKGSFREDLFYRINIVTISLPPLKERRCDIPILCAHFVDKFNIQYKKHIAGVSNDAMQLLLAHEFPGNIRELENIIEHAFIFCKDEQIGTTHLPALLRDHSPESDSAVLSSIKNFEELERLYLKAILAECGNDRIKAAERLGIHKATIFRKIKQLGL